VKPTRLKSWSYSTLKSYKQCPLTVKFNKIDGIKDPGSAAMDRGNEIHKEAEDYIREAQKVLPASLKLFEKEFKQLAKANAVPEEEVAFNKNWEPVAWAVGWVRAKIDVYFKRKGRKGTTEMTIIDYKTGKVYEENKKQLSFYALLGFILHPEVNVINVELWYIDQGPGATHQDTYRREEMEDMRAAWDYEVQNMMADDIFAPRPGYYCKWCFYSKNKNGNCIY